jgi:ABC-2 type transport system permease protein
MKYSSNIHVSFIFDSCTFASTFIHFMSDQYNHFQALKALTKASLQSILKSPSAVVFSIAFPLVFIIAFGFLGGGKPTAIPVAFEHSSDTNSALVQHLLNSKAIQIKQYNNATAIEKSLKEGHIKAVLSIKSLNDNEGKYDVRIQGVQAQAAAIQQLQATFNEAITQLNPQIKAAIDSKIAIHAEEASFRTFNTIDFILPGQLGFSLLAGSVFGTAFIFFNMRQTLVLKRFFATPVRRGTILVSEGIARLAFQIITAAIIIGIGYAAFDFYLIKGWVTVLQMLILCIIGVMVFMGFGFSVSGIAKSESSIPPLANIITMPQFLLAGTFFSIDTFPKWIQYFSKAMPLTYLNEALRKTAFEGASLWDLRIEIIVLLAWGVAIYVLASKVFKWE